MARQPDEHITFPEPPESVPGIRRLNSFLRIGAVSAVLAAAYVGAGRSSFAGSGSTCSPAMASEVSAALAELALIQAQEEALRRRLAGPGVFVPKNLETYQ